MKLLLLTITILCSIKALSQSLLEDKTILIGSVRCLEKDVHLYKEIAGHISSFIKEKDSFIFDSTDERNKDALFTYPFKLFYKTEKSYGEDYKVTPNLVSLYETESNFYIAKIMWVFPLKEGGTFLHMINDFLIYYKDKQFKLYNITNYILKDWERKKKGAIEYVFKQNYYFNNEKADQMLAFHNKMAIFFGLEVFDFKYIICKDTNDLYKTQGFDFHLDMYGPDIISGSAYVEDNIIFAGNNSEFYPHEIVHLHTYQKFGSISSFLDEGLATYLGGALGISYDMHLDKLKSFFKINQNKIFLEECFSNKLLDKETSLSTIGAAFLCQMVYNDCGKDYLFDMLKFVNREDEKNDIKKYLIDVYGIKKHDLNKFIINKLVDK